MHNTDDKDAAVHFWSIFSPELAEAFERKYRAELEQEKIDALAEFAAGAGHEINNPLAIINGRAQLLMRELTCSDHQKHLVTIIAQVKRAYEMIADVRLFARPPKPELRDVEVGFLLREVIEQFKKSTDNDHLNIEWDMHNILPFPSILTDPVHLQTIFSCLCKNSVEALTLSVMSPKLIKWSCRPQINHVTKDEYIEIVIEDNGSGIPTKHLKLIFSPYFSGRQAGRGLGFGLPKVWRLLEQLGGTIFAENCTPRGARFVIKLPNNPNTDS